MKKQNNKNKKKIEMLVFLIMGTIVSIFYYYTWDSGKLLAIVLFLSISSIPLVIPYLKRKGIIKEKKKYKFNLENESKEEIIENIKKNKEYNKLAEKRLEKLPKSKEEKIADNFNTIIYATITVIIIGLFYLGSIPSYFGVNDEFTNPTNQSLGLNQTYEMVKDVGLNLTNNLMNIGRRNPKFWFWGWWVVVFMIMILPILRIVKYLIEIGLEKYNKNLNKTN